MSEKESVPDLEKEITRIRSFTTRELQEKFKEIFNESTRSSNRTYLMRRVVWGIQMQHEGGLSEQAKKRAQELSRIEDVRTCPPTTTHKIVLSERDPRLPKVGSIIRRSYKDEELEVRVLDDGFEWRDKTWKSLSAIAKEVTGQNWNGFAFFKLGKKGSK